MERKEHLTDVRRLVVKIGTRLVAKGTQAPDLEFLDQLARQLAELRERGLQTVLVVSGAVHLGRRALGLRGTLKELSLRQAAAAVGQPELLHLYLEALSAHGLLAAQILLTAEDMADRARYLNARNTVEALLKQQAVPVINENDSVSVEGVTFGENDRLAAIVAAGIHADGLFLLSDQAGVHTADPRKDEQAKMIWEVPPDGDILHHGEAAGGTESRGGMRAKISAAQMARDCGLATFIADGAEENVVLRLLAGERLGTFFLPGERRRGSDVWIATAVARGQLIVDEGAQRALGDPDGASLLPVGIVQVEGEFHAGDVVEVLGPEGQAIAQGIVNYSAADIRKIKGLQSRDVRRILGRLGPKEVIHRDYMVVT